MNRRLLTILLVAFVIASGCTLLVYRLIGNRLGATRATGTRVIATASDIKLGAILDASSVTTIEITGPLPKGAILEKDKSTVIGRGVISDLYQGEPIIESRLAAPGSGGGLAATIPTGMRACAVKVDDVVGVAGFATPGMRVDVVISGIPPGQSAGTQDTVAKTILQNIEVLSAGTDIQKDANGKAKPVQVVNLLVSPQQAQTLSLATNQAKIQLVLRNPLDTTVATIPGAAMGSLYAGDNGIPASVQPVAVARVAHRTAPKPFSVEVINGSKRSQENFASPEEKQ
jgi:pilus assembly protein CpaB